MVADRTITQPETYRMVVDSKQKEKITDAIRMGDYDAAAKELGGWATKDPITSLSDVRNNLAIAEAFKKGDLFVVEFTVKPGVGVREGVVGPMWDPAVGKSLPGGGQQANFMVGLPRFKPELFQVNPSSIVELK